MDIEALGLDADGEDSTDSRADNAAIDLVKQMITLSAGVLALSATFLEKAGAIPTALLIVLAGAWLALILSVFGGIQTLSTIVKSRLNADDGWSKGAGKRYARLSKYGFLVGLSLFAVFAFILLHQLKPHVELPNVTSASKCGCTPSTVLHPATE